MDNTRLASSFRDPSGFLFKRDGKVLRQVNAGYREHYDLLMNSGLYASLTAKHWLVTHEEREIDHTTHAYRILEPEQVR